jgi:hypothetical protein
MADIRIDTSQLSFKWFIIPSVITDPTDGSTPLSLEPGEYDFQQFVGFLASINFTFRVNPDGTVDYDASNNGFLSGRGTPTLIVRGSPITLDGTTLSHDLLPFGPLVENEILTRDRTHVLTLVPGKDYKFLPTNQFAPTSVFEFEITTNGAIDYNPSNDDFLKGRGTPRLIVQGFPITIDGTALSHDLKPLHLLGNEEILTRDRTHVLTLVPGATYQFMRSDQSEAIFGFEVTTNGTVYFHEGNDSFLSGRGTSTFKILSFPVN